MRRSVVSCIVRPARTKDTQPIARLCQQLGYAATSQEVEQRLGKIKQNQEHAIYVATLNSDRILGWIHAHKCDLLITPTQALVLGLVVDEEFRDRGIGRMLMEQIEDWARDRGCQAVLVRSNTVRQQAHRFYQKIGYTQIKQSLVFCKTLNSE